MSLRESEREHSREDERECVIEKQTHSVIWAQRCEQMRVHMAFIHITQRWASHTHTRVVMGASCNVSIERCEQESAHLLFTRVIHSVERHIHIQE